MEQAVHLVVMEDAAVVLLPFLHATRVEAVDVTVKVLSPTSSDVAVRFTLPDDT